MTYEDVKRIRQNTTTENVDNAELSRMIDAAIKKQIRKKPNLVKFKKTTIAYCPSCGNSFGELKPVPCIYITMQLSAYNNHQATACDCCGQAIDWSGGNEQC